MIINHYQINQVHVFYFHFQPLKLITLPFVAFFKTYCISTHYGLVLTIEDMGLGIMRNREQLQPNILV